MKSRTSILPIVPAILSLVGFLALRTPAAEKRPQPADLLTAIENEVDAAQAMQYMRRIYATDHWFTFPKFRETIEYLSGAMREAGLKQVEILEAPADGETQFGFWTMPLAWDIKEGRLEIVEPEPPLGFKILADYQTFPHSVGMWSGSTPPGGVVAEVVEIPGTKPEDVEEIDLEGKLVLTDRNPAGFKWLLVKKGALGAINTFTENPDLKDDRQWLNAWGDAGWGYTKTSTPLLSFSIAPRQAQVLRELLAEHGTVKVRAEVDSRYYKGVYPYITGIVPGEDGEEVLTLGHTAEAGAHDNATGVAAMVEALSTIHRLIEAGKLPRPRRTIRMLGMGEYYCTHHYIDTHRKRMSRTVAAYCLDTPAGPYELANTEYTYYLNPHVAKSYTDAFSLKLAETYFPRHSRPWHWKSYMAGTDTFLADPTIGGGIPTIWPYSSSGVHSHHNSADTPDTVDIRSLRDLTVTTAAYLYYLADAGVSEAHWLAEVALTRGVKRVAEETEPFLDQVPQAANSEQLGRLLFDAREKTRYQVEREQQAISSVLRLVGAEDRDRARQDLAPGLEQLEQAGQANQRRVRRAVARRAEELSSTPPIEAVAPPRTPKIAEAEKIVVKRKRFGTIPLDDLPVPEREGYPNGAWSVEPITLLYWCDGKRNLAEVMRLTRLELSRPLKLDAVGYFRFLAEHGYVELVEQGNSEGP